jgi:hypothetical protein
MRVAVTAANQQKKNFMERVKCVKFYFKTFSPNRVYFLLPDLGSEDGFL